ncbi:hypothetical protein EJ08DRAFT_498638 [Tothia fuscella]|uniref:Uncharacterized protein n=1 Tax=Tothia fuscella TaxID=1048955 RepID=A0A9P4P048_9PEZI|nr:hypothetical protein EJ08DRAFT_498638 [Tothia fuscella]
MPDYVDRMKILFCICGEKVNSCGTAPVIFRYLKHEPMIVCSDLSFLLKVPPNLVMSFPFIPCRNFDRSLISSPLPALPEIPNLPPGMPPVKIPITATGAMTGLL